MNADQQQVVSKMLSTGIKDCLRMHFKMLQRATIQLSDPLLELSPDEMVATRNAMQADISANIFIWTYLNICIQNQNLDTLRTCWEDVEFRTKALIAVIQFMHVKAQELIQENSLVIPQDQSIADLIWDH